MSHTRTNHKTIQAAHEKPHLLLILLPCSSSKSSVNLSGSTHVVFASAIVTRLIHLPFTIYLLQALVASQKHWRPLSPGRRTCTEKAPGHKQMPVPCHLPRSQSS